MSLRNLYRMAVFARIVEKGSFSEAARSLGIAKSAVSQHLTALEEALDVTLMTRSTRALALTDEGRDYYESCARIVGEAERAQQSLDNARESEKGKVRLTCSYNLGLNFVVPALAEFRQLHPHIELDLVLEDRILNIVDEGIDLSLRSGWLTDSALFAVSLAPMEMVLCASEAYLRAHGEPEDPAALANHTWIGISGVFNPDRLSVETDAGKKATVALNTPIRVNSGMAARFLIEAGAGLGMLPNYAIQSALEQRDIVRILPEWRSKRGTISALFPSRHHMSKRSRVLIDFLRNKLRATLGDVAKEVT